MSPRGRTVLIVVAISLILFACGAVALAAGAVAEAARKAEWYSPGPRRQARVTRTFDVGDRPIVDIRNFCGNVTIRVGRSGVVRIEATKSTSGPARPNQINVTMRETAHGVTVRSDAPGISDRACVKLVLAVPADAQLEVWTGAGDVEIIGVEGDIAVEVGAGNIAIRETRGRIDAKAAAGTVYIDGSVGPVRAETNVGAIVYAGTPQGLCVLESDVGAISIKLPAKQAAALDLRVGMGGIDLGLPVRGSVSARRVEGTIGDGDGCTIQASSRLGGIGLGSR